MTTSKGIIFLLLEWDSMSLLVAGWFFSQKIGWSWKFTLPLLPCLLDWGGFGSWGSLSRPESQVHLFNHGIATVMEMKLGKMDLLGAAWSRAPVGA